MATDAISKQREKFVNKMSKMFKDDFTIGTDGVALSLANVIPIEHAGLGESLNYWGIPKGKITQLYGPYGSGKTFLAMLLTRQAQILDPESFVVWLDCEFSFNKAWAQKIGIDLDRLIVFENNSGPQVFKFFAGDSTEGILDMVLAGEIKVSLMVMDSIAAMIPPVESGRNFEDQDMAALARFLPKAFRQASAKLNRANVPMVCINQAREKIGDFIKGGYSFPGGNAYGHLMSCSVLCVGSNAKDATLYDERGEKVGHKMLCTVEKTRGGTNKGKVEVWFDFRSGFAKLGEDVANLGASYGVIRRPNNRTWEYKEHKLIGKDNFALFLDQETAVKDQIIADIKECKLSGAIPLPEESDGSSEETEES